LTIVQSTKDKRPWNRTNKLSHPFDELGWAPVEDMAPKLHRDPIMAGLEVESEVPNEIHEVQPSEMELKVASPPIAYSSHLLAWAVWILFF
jgi:hypothetical protein